MLLTSTPLSRSTSRTFRSVNATIHHALICILWNKQYIKRWRLITTVVFTIYLYASNVAKYSNYTSTYNSLTMMLNAVQRRSCVNRASIIIHQLHSTVSVALWDASVSTRLCIRHARSGRFQTLSALEEDWVHCSRSVRRTRVPGWPQSRRKMPEVFSKAIYLLFHRLSQQKVNVIITFIKSQSTSTPAI